MTNFGNKNLHIQYVCRIEYFLFFQISSMDNRETDRHRNRARIWESGASKRRKAKEAAVRSADVAKTRKLEVFHYSTKASIRKEW